MTGSDRERRLRTGLRWLVAGSALALIALVSWVIWAAGMGSAAGIIAATSGLVAVTVAASTGLVAINAERARLRGAAEAQRAGEARV